MSASTTSNNATTTVVTPARFTKVEKSVLYELFNQNEDVIDIKSRRNSTKKNISVRECWDRIAVIYNNHPETTTIRNVKQIQKFWLNARLRKHYPVGSSDNASNTNNNNKSTKHGRLMKRIENVNVIDTNIKFEKDGDESEEMKYEKECNESEEMLQDDDNEMQHEVEISTSSNDVLLDNTTSTTTTTHQYNIDHISADKLTLTDLLEFKNSRSTRPGDEIVLQIKTPGDPLTSHHHHQQKDNNIITGVSNNNNNNSTLQAYTTTSYRIANPTTAILTEQYQTAPIVHQPQIIQQQQQPPLPHLHHKSTPIITNQQTCCSHNNTSNTSIISTPNIDNNIEDKINFYRMKEAELKYKEEQLKLEQSKIELAQAKEVLKHMKELHVYQIEEMKLKLRLLNAEDKKSSASSKINNVPVFTVKKL